MCVERKKKTHGDIDRIAIKTASRTFIARVFSVCAVFFFLHHNILSDSLASIPLDIVTACSQAHSLSCYSFVCRWKMHPKSNDNVPNGYFLSLTLSFSSYTCIHATLFPAPHSGMRDSELSQLLSLPLTDTRNFRSSKQNRPTWTIEFWGEWKEKTQPLSMQMAECSFWSQRHYVSTSSKYFFDVFFRTIFSQIEYENNLVICVMNPIINGW